MERCHTSTSRVGPRKGWGCLVDILNQICSVRDVPSYNLTMQINVQKSKIYIIISAWKKKFRYNQWCHTKISFPQLLWFDVNSFERISDHCIMHKSGDTIIT